MRRHKLTRPVVELFSDGEILDSFALNRLGAFDCPNGMAFPFRRLRTYRDHIELRWPNPDEPPQIIPVEYSRLNYGGAGRPWFLCKCGRRCAKLYVNSINVWCRRCGDLQFRSQAQTRKARLVTKAEKIRNRLWIENNNPIRPRYMPHAIFERHLSTLSKIEHAIRHNLHCASIRYRRHRERDSDGRYWAMSRTN
jgi:hypothetical protein